MLKYTLQKHQNSKVKFLVYLLLILYVCGFMIFSIIESKYNNLLTCLLVLVAFIIPSFIQRKFRITLNSTIEITTILFIFSCVILGEIHHFYKLFWFWDIIMHFISGFLGASVGFIITEYVTRKKKINLDFSPMFLFIIAFCVSMTIGLFWEFFEFGSDQIFNTDMQTDTIINKISSTLLDKTNSNKPVIINSIHEVIVNGQKLEIDGYLDIGLIDTMKDLFLNAAGALVFCFLLYFFIKRGRTNNLIKKIMPKIR